MVANDGDQTTYKNTLITHWTWMSDTDWERDRKKEIDSVKSYVIATIIVSHRLQTATHTHI